MRILIFIFLCSTLGACQRHSKESERNALLRLNYELRQLDKQCLIVLTDVDETNFDQLDSMFITTKDTIWIDLKEGYIKSENRMIEFCNLVDQEEKQLIELEEAVTLRKVIGDEFYTFLKREELNVQRLEMQIDNEIVFRKELRALKNELRKID